jgi:siroheme synthase
LLDAGLDANTPAAIVSAASTPKQREHCTTLGQLDSAPPMPTPTILLIGRTLERAAPSVTNSVPLTWESLLDGVEVSIAEKNANQSLERSLT